MIEISHKQAQHLIREAQDRRLPEEQWAVLYAHLENCLECRAYRERLSSYEHDLHRMLQTRWAAARGPAEGIAERIIRIKNFRKQLLRIVRRSGLYVFGALAIIGYILYREATAPPPPPPSTATPQFGFGSGNSSQTVTPSPLQSEFHDLIAFESHRDGNAEIYLLGTSPEGPQLTNLTQNPAQDTQPAWSPDGQWVAFLSDRTGKNEVYVIHVAGSRLTQLTNSPDIEWSGPLAWSYDGRWLGLSGQKGGLGGAPFLYLVPLDGSSQPSSIGFTFSADPWMRFSPGQPALAYHSTRRPGGIDAVNTNTGLTGAITLPEEPGSILVAGQNGAFDWSLGGRSLVYLDQPASSGQSAHKTSDQIRETDDIDVQNRESFNKIAEKTVDSLPETSHFRAVSWLPRGVIVASLVKEGSGPDDSSACWMIRLSNTKNAAATPLTVPDICVTGGLDHFNWSPDGKWLVVVGRRPAEQTSAIYALRLPDITGRADTSRGQNLLPGSTYIERLAEIPAADLPVKGSSGSQPEYFAEPHVRPDGQMMNYIPKAIPPPEAAPAALIPSPQTPGWIAYRVQRGADSWIVRSRPDGSGYLFLTDSRGVHSCPRISPDRTRVAYLSDDGNPGSGIDEVFITGVDRTNTTRLTHNPFPVAVQAGASAPVLPRYGCPVWSPDSKTLAAILTTKEQTYLAVIPTDGQTPARYFETDAVSNFAPPVWVPAGPGNPAAGNLAAGNLAAGSSQILLIYKTSGQITRLVSVDINASENMQPAKIVAKNQFYPWDDVQDMVLSPDGKRLAITLIFENITGVVNLVAGSTAKLEVLDMASLQAISDIDLPDYDPDTAGLGGLGWQPDGKLWLAQINSLIGAKKTLFERFDPGASRIQTKFEPLTSFDEVAYRAVWIGASWVAYVSESGLWVVNLDEAKAERASPAMLSGEMITDVDAR